MQAIEYDCFDKLNCVGYMCLFKLLPGCSFNVGERSSEVDCCICCIGGAIYRGSTVGWIGAWVV